MTDLRSSQTSFESPPVYETALAIQFEELTKFRAIHFGRFHQTVRDQFPESEDHGRTEPINETFPTVPRQLRLQLVEKKHGPERVWFRDRVDGSLLLQLQPDRFGLNWRRVEGSGAYPSFEQNGEMFLERFARFQQFCDDEGIGPLNPDWVEVVYVNHIVPFEGETAVDCFGTIFEGLNWGLSDQWLSSPELVTFNRVFPIGDQQGRLFAEAGVARGSQSREIVLMKMTARVMHKSGSQLAESLQLAHNFVTNGFVSLTTDAARQERWGQAQ